MVDTNTEEFVLKIDDSQAKRSAGEVEKRLGKMFDQSALKAAAFNQALSLGQRAMAGLVEWVKKGVESAIQYERTTNQLNTVLRSLGDSGGVWVGILQRQSSVLERLTGISDETIRQYQIMALNMGTASDRVDDLIRASVSLGNAMDMDVRTAMIQIVKTQTGLVEETLKATGAVDGLTQEQLKAGEAIDVINEKFHEQLTVMTEGGAGATVGLATAWANLGEEIGKFATMGPAVSTLTTIADVIQQMADGLSRIRNLDVEALGKAYLGTLTAPFAGIPGALGLAAYGAGSAGGGGGMLPLEPLVKPTAVGGGGRRSSGKGGGKKGGITFGSDFGGEFGAGGDAIFVEGVGYISQAEYAAHQNLRYDLEASYQDKLAALQESQVQYWMDLEDKKTQHIESSAQQQMQAYQLAASAGSQALDLLMGAVEKLIAGQDVAWAQMAAGFVKSIGRQIMGQGIADVLKGTSMLLTSFGVNPQAHALISHGGVEMGIGGAMMASGAIVAGLTAGGGGGGGGAPSLGDTAQQIAGDFAGGVGGGSASGSSGGGGDKSITIILQGPVYDGAQAGREIHAKIAEAKRQGLI